MSILLANGHQDARRYPIGRVGYEASLINDRLNQSFVTQAVMTQQAIISILSKDGAREFEKLIKSLSDGG